MTAQVTSPRDDAPDGAVAVAPDAVRAQLSRILGDRRFEAVPQRRELLRFVVEETLAGRGDRLKGYVIATQVFGRPDDFDQRIDPIVRIEARRLRRDLDSYYMGPGRNDPLVISIPKGRYLPLFMLRPGVVEAALPDAPAPEEESAAFPGPASRDRRLRLRHAWLAMAAGLAVVLLVAGFAARAYLAPTRGAGLAEHRLPAVAVLSFRPSTDSGTERVLAEGIAHDLVSNLMRFPDFRLYAMPPGPVPEDVAYLVTGEIAAEAERIRLAVQFLDAGTRRVVWSRTYQREFTAGTLLALRAEIAGEIATALGQPYGAIHTDILARGIADLPANLESYVCVQRAHQYRRDFLDEDRAEVRACLDAAVAADPGYAEAWAMLAWLHLDEGRFAAASEEQASRAYERGSAAASRALALDAGNVQALKALSSISHYLGRYEEGWRLAREALARNPYDPDTMAQLGWRLAVRGRFDEGVPLIRRAIERSVRPPGWYYDLIAIDHLMRGEHREMRAALERSARQDSAMNHALIAIAEARLGDERAAGAALRRMAELSPRLAEDRALLHHVRGHYRPFRRGLPLYAARACGIRVTSGRSPVDP